MIRKLQRSDFELIDLQERQFIFADFLLDDSYREILLNADSYCLSDGLNTIAMGGLIDMGYGRAQGWSLLGKDAKKHLLEITRAINLQINNVEYKRIEITVEQGFKEAERWADMLGFTLEAEMKNYFNGETHLLYARYK